MAEVLFLGFYSGPCYLFGINRIARYILKRKLKVIIQNMFDLVLLSIICVGFEVCYYCRF